MRIPEQVQRLAILVGIVVALTLVTRFYLIPRSVVDSEMHVSAAIQRVAAQPIQYAGAAACAECHDDVTAKKAKSFHKNVACGTCHGPANKHIEDPMAVKPPAPRDRKFCPVCHIYDPSRPTGFPQINPTAHNPLKPCIACHNPHDPVPPRTPQACSACHAQIERTKSVSSHALLSCTTCHRAPELHKRSPRAALPSIPDSRDFCAGCHGAGQKDAPKEAPKVDVTTHGGRFLCWQCHYPHLPEGRA